MQLFHGYVAQESQTIHFFLFEMERKHIRFQVQTDTRERELHFTLLYLFSSVFSEIFKTVR